MANASEGLGADAVDDGGVRQFADGGEGCEGGVDEAVTVTAGDAGDERGMSSVRRRVSSTTTTSIG